MDRQLLNRATDGTDAPTPGYLYVDIAKNASSSPIACQEIATFLSRKLANKQNANIKWKCLKVITKTAETVHRGQFKRAVAQDQAAVAAIRLCANFRGPPDPVRGDEPNNRVRIAAKECLDIIYSDTPSTGEASPYSTGGGGGGISNTYGSAPHATNHQQASQYGGAGGGGGGGGGANRMEGIGNPMFSDPRNDPQPDNFGAIMKDVGESFVGMIKDPLARNADVRISNGHGEMPRPGGGYNGGGGGGGHGGGRPGNSYGAPPGRNELAQATGGQWTMASNRGPGAVGGSGGGGGAPGHGGSSNDAYYKSKEQGNNAFNWANKDAHPGASGVGGSWASSGQGVAGQARQGSYAEQHSGTPSITVNHGHSAAPTVNHGGGGTAVSDGSYEKNLIMELCPPGGMKPVPPPDKLLSFSKAIPNLNPDLICPVLLDCLEDGHPWIMRAKALCVMETCILAGNQPDNTNPYANFLYTCREEIDPLTNHTRAAIRDPARRVLALMGIESTGQTAAAPAGAPPAPPPPAAPVNLLDFDDAPASAPPGPPPTAPPPPPVTPPPTAVGGGGSMFGGLQVKSVAAAPAAATAPPAAPTSGNLLDGFGIPPSQPPAPAPAAAPTDMFASMTVKPLASEEEKKSASTDAGDLTSVVASGSAFGFMNDTGSAPPVAAAAPAKETFDPLLANFSPNTAKAMMQVSPDQMQAMAYQQMLMQQQAMQMQNGGMPRAGAGGTPMQMQQMQMQMQQMQMAMQMQNGGGMPRAGAGGAPMQMQQMQMPGVGGGMPNQQRPGVMGPHAGNTSTGFSFLDNTVKKVDHSFDFVQDAMKNVKK